MTRICYLTIVALLTLLPTSATSAADALTVCHQSTVALPTLQQQRDWLRDNKRYGPEIAAAYYTAAEKFGDNFIQYQAHYQQEPSGSLRMDIKQRNGIYGARQAPFPDSSDCNTPVLLLVGLKPMSIEGSVLYVSESRGLYSVVSFVALEEPKRPFQLKLAGSNNILCKDFRHACSDLSGNFKPTSGNR